MKYVFDAHDNYISQLLPLISNISRKIISALPTPEQPPSYKDALLNALISGRIKYENNYFKGQFTKEIANKLKSLQAIKSTRGFYLERMKVPLYVLRVIDKKQQLDTQNTTLISKGITSLETSDFISATMLATITTTIHKRIVKNAVKGGFKNISSIRPYSIHEKLSEGLTDNLKSSLANLAEYLIKYGTDKTMQQLESLLSYSVKSRVKDVVLTTTNQSLFEIQKKMCEDNDVNNFLWWHVPVKKPSDRQYHREHYEASKKGKRFSWDNLPRWNGEPDYPGKLWHCRCRAFIDEKEFKMAK